MVVLTSFVLVVTSLFWVPTRAWAGCDAAGSSNGVSAEAVARCSTHPDGLVSDTLDPGLGCRAVSYELVVADDSAVAVFPTTVVADYSSHLDPVLSAADGSANNFGTLVDVLGFGGPARAVGIALDPSFGDRRFSATGRWWRRVCWADGPDSAQILVPSSIDGPYPEGDEVPLSTLLGVARAQVNPPPVPAFEHSGPASLTQLPTWFWADRSWWESSYRGEQSHGRVTVAVAAAPTAWELVVGGEGVVRCQGRGQTWQRGRKDREGCTHTFSEAVDSGRTSLDFTVTMNVAWSASIPGYGIQPLAPIYRTVDQDHLVIEVLGLRG